jgi:hypothetical protein
MHPVTCSLGGLLRTSQALAFATVTTLCRLYRRYSSYATHLHTFSLFRHHASPLTAAINVKTSPRPAKDVSALSLAWLFQLRAGPLPVKVSTQHWQSQLTRLERQHSQNPFILHELDTRYPSRLSFILLSHPPFLLFTAAPEMNKRIPY